MIYRNIIVAALLLVCTACTKVPAGTVGVMVDLYGSSKGVQAQQVGPGRYWVGYNQDLFIFPTFTQTRTWSAKNRDDNLDESITFQSMDGSVINTDAGVTFHVEPDKVSVLFQRYRKGIDEITEVYVHNMVRDGFVEEASHLSVEQVYGSGKSALIDTVQKRVQDQVRPFGLVIEKVYLVGTLRLPPNVVSAINSKNSAIQLAEQRKNELVQSQAEAQKEIAKANGTAQSLLINAEAEAKALRLRGDALRDSPSLVQLNAVEKWDGHLPNVNGGAVPFISVAAK